MWQDDVVELPTYAMFGENLTVANLDEREAYFGNQYQLGDAIIEVSEIREPCWKIQAKYQIPDLVKRMSTSGKTGFYFRVIKEGYVSCDDHLKLIKTADKDTQLSVYELNDVYYNDRKNASRLSYALQNPYLTSKRKEKLQRLLTRAQ
jgi:MOSC domain-containing protein YiiM